MVAEGFIENLSFIHSFIGWLVVHGLHMKFREWGLSQPGHRGAKSTNPSPGWRDSLHWTRGTHWRTSTKTAR